MAQFDIAITEKDKQSFDPVPAGKYKMAVTQSEMKATKTGGQMLKVTFEIQSGQYKGRLIFGNFNIINANADAVRIARGQLAALAVACKKTNVTDSEQLHNITFIGTVTIRNGDGDYGPQNEVKKFESVEAADAPQGEAASRPW